MGASVTLLSSWKGQLFYISFKNLREFQHSQPTPLPPPPQPMTCPEPPGWINYPISESASVYYACTNKLVTSEKLHIGKFPVLLASY